MKALGADILAFWAEWPPGDDWWYDEHGGIQIDDDYGTPQINTAEKYDLSEFGAICWQGQGAPPKGAEDGVSFESWFKKWKKGNMQGLVTVAVTLSEQELDAFREYAASQGWRVRK